MNAVLILDLLQENILFLKESDMQREFIVIYCNLFLLWERERDI